MRYISWNVNGLRAVIKKGFEDIFWSFDADFVCLQETKLQEGQVQLDLPGYESYWCYAERKGYSGTAIFTKHTPLSVSYNLGLPEHDTEGRVITLEYDKFYLVCVYTPNAQDGLRRIDYRMSWEDDFRAYLVELDRKKPVIVCGDMNVAHEEIDLKNPKTISATPAFRMRSAANLPSFLTPVLPTASATSTPTGATRTPGGATAPPRVSATSVGALTTSSCPTACAKTSRTPTSSPR